MQNLTFKHTKKYCYFTYLAMSSVFSLPPLLFATFKETYGISYTLLGTLVLINFCTQLGIDLIFSFLSKHFNIRLTVRIMPLITATGLGIYALTPTLFPEYAYAGLITGTFIFSVASGLASFSLRLRCCSCCCCQHIVSPLCRQQILDVSDSFLGSFTGHFFNITYDLSTS